MNPTNEELIDIVTDLRTGYNVCLSAKTRLQGRLDVLESDLGRECLCRESNGELINCQVCEEIAKIKEVLK